MSRIFAAIPISPFLQDIISSWQKDWPTLPVRWLKGKNLHVTVVPPWEENNIESAITSLRQLAGFLDEPLQLDFRRVTFGPNPREPRLIWATGESPSEIPKLLKDLAQALGQPLPDREFRLHLTLARFRSEQFTSFRIKKLDEPVNWLEKASSLVLMESHLLPQGAEYKVLAEVQLVKT